MFAEGEDKTSSNHSIPGRKDKERAKGLLLAQLITSVSKKKKFSEITS